MILYNQNQKQYKYLIVFPSNRGYHSDFYLSSSEQYFYPF